MTFKSDEVNIHKALKALVDSDKRTTRYKTRERSDSFFLWFFLLKDLVVQVFHNESAAVKTGKSFY